MLEFFGLKDFHDGGFHYIREAEGAWSWQHITFVSLCLAVMFALAIFFGLRNKNQTDKKKNKVLIVSAFLINGFEIVKIVVLCIRAQDPLKWLYVLPPVPLQYPADCHSDGGVLQGEIERGVS